MEMRIVRLKMFFRAPTSRGTKRRGRHAERGTERQREERQREKR